MTDAKKFGTFAGVFTPSILTILGVIMYLRLGWVVGNAGLWGTILIIIVAHVISITTGLSVSSIATDKKVGAGGIYYVLSRSMGLPIGGAIGLTIFVGTALSISLYLVGFAESFNESFGLGNDLNSYRLTGSAALLVLMIIAMISTSVALKTQFFILGAIFISLISIFFGSSESAPDMVPSFSGADSAPMMEVFAIFFPAVTGFTAGVAMSGDLKDPKKSIPIGTIASIAVGFLVYIILAVFLAFSIDRDLLMTDNNILFKFALLPQAVLAGIWGATLSSALGGILGAPRILQALSVDKITPVLFGKGRGQNNEPWNALFLCCLIAEAGILIGELDVIARVVSMFYLTAYGFINLTFFLESWASSDFSPTFKVSRWLGFLGAVATFIVMLQLDLLAMLVAFLIIGGIYLWLVRKELTLGTGDIWNSVWTSVVKKGLQRMDVNEEHKRNWKPNILLFSGGTKQRPHLLEFADALTGKAGIATNFDLIENPEATVLFPKHKQAVTDEALQKYGMFGRRLEVQNVFKGVESIATTYGFSGIEPNSVLMGWPRNTRDPMWFAQMTQKLIDLDYNVLYLDYDRRFGFRDYKTIDMWWRDISNNAELMLSLTRFILKSNKWRQARLRILLANNENIDQPVIEVRIKKILEQFRIKAEIKIINNAVEQKSIFQLMRVHSAEAALVMLGIPDIQEGGEKRFVMKTNDLVDVIGTTLLVKASSYFDATDLGLRAMAGKPVREENVETVALELPDDESLEKHIKSLDHQIEISTNELIKNSLIHISKVYINLVEDARKDVITFFKELQPEISAIEAYDHIIKLLNQLKERLVGLRQNDLETLYELFNKAIAKWIQDREAILANAPAVIEFNAFDQEGKNTSGNKVRFPWKEQLTYYLETFALPRHHQIFLDFGYRHLTFIYDYYDLIENKLTTLLSQFSNADIEKCRLWTDDVQKNCTQSLESLRQLAVQLESTTVKEIKAIDRLWCNEIIHQTNWHDNKSKERSPQKSLKRKEIKEYTRGIEAYPYYWYKNQLLLHQQFEAGFDLKSTGAHLGQLVETVREELLNAFIQPFRLQLKNLVDNIHQTQNYAQQNQLKQVNAALFRMDDENVLFPENYAQQFKKPSSALIENLPVELQILSSESLNQFKNQQNGSLQTIELKLEKIGELILNEQLYKPLEVYFKELSYRVNQFHIQALNASNFLSYSINTAQEESDTNQMLAEIIDQTEKQILNVQNELDILSESLPKELENILQKNNASLEILAINQNSTFLKQQVRQKERLSFLTKRVDKRKIWLEQYWEKWSAFFNRLKKDWNTARLEQQYSAYSNPFAQLVAFTETISLKPALKKQLPFYYQQLFAGKHLGFGNQLNNREREEQMARKAIDHINAGFAGGILIIGEARSGKSFLTEHIAHTYFNGPIYHIFPLGETSAEYKDLEKSFQNACHSSKSIPEILEALPERSTFIFNDIELWWFKGTDGNTVIDRLTEIIQKYGNRHYFLLNASVFAFQALRQSTKINQALIQTIFLSPMSVKEIQDVILYRHRTGGMDFKYQNRSEKELSTRQLRQLFLKFHRLTNGNIGMALQLWKANINSLEDYTIVIDDLSPVEFPTIQNPAWKVLLYQFILHKSLTKEQLLKLFPLQSAPWLEEHLESLLRTSLIYEPTKNIFILSPKSRPYIEAWLKEINVLSIEPV